MRGKKGPLLRLYAEDLQNLSKEDFAGKVAENQVRLGQIEARRCELEEALRLLREEEQDLLALKEQLVKESERRRKEARDELLALEQRYESILQEVRRKLASLE